MRASFTCRAEGFILRACIATGWPPLPTVSPKWHGRQRRSSIATSTGRSDERGSSNRLTHLWGRNSRPSLVYLCSLSPFLQLALLASRTIAHSPYEPTVLNPPSLFTPCIARPSRPQAWCTLCWASTLRIPVQGIPSSNQDINASPPAPMNSTADGATQLHAISAGSER